MISLIKLTDAEIIALADEAESFWSTGVSPKDSGLRKIIQERNMEDHAGELLLMSGEIFREVWFRRLVRPESTDTKKTN